jgi:hypothetical protein
VGSGIGLKRKSPANHGLAELLKIAVRTGLEPATPCVTGMYSNQLNYRTVFFYQNRTAKVVGSSDSCKLFAKNFFIPDQFFAVAYL